MAEITSGAVSSLLGLLKKEAQLLGGVGSDVDFIRDEMESMNSFLVYLSSRTAAHHHDEQVRTWMGQVRNLVNDCNTCINDYLLSGDRAVHIARGGRLRHYAWWTYWLVLKMVARHRAATRLRELKDRVGDVSSRRLRYGVEIPGLAGTAAAATAPAEEEDDEEEEHQVPGAPDDHDPRRRALEPRTVEDFCAEKLVNWFSSSRKLEAGRRQEGRCSIPCIAIVAPDAGASAAAAQAASYFAAAAHFERTVSINLQALHHSWDLPLLPQEILCYILRECKQQGTDQQLEQLEDRERTYQEIWGKIDKINIHDKVNILKEKIGEVDRSIAQVDSKKKAEETKRLKATACIALDLDTPLAVLHRPI